MSAGHPRPDLAEYADAPMSQPAAILVDYLGKVTETCTVRQWADGTRSISNREDVERLRIAYRAARLITESSIDHFPRRTVVSAAQICAGDRR